jgi:hypothetical protein
MKNDLLEDTSKSSNGFVAVANDFLTDNTLTPTEKIVALWIARFQKGYHGTVATLAASVGIEVKTARRALRSLEEKKVVIAIPREGRTTLFAVFYTSKRIVMRPDSETYEAARKRVFSRRGPWTKTVGGVDKNGRGPWTKTVGDPGQKR